MQALDDCGGVDEVSAAEGTQQVLVDVIDATSSTSAHLLTRHVTSRRCSRLVADDSGRLHHNTAACLRLPTTSNTTPPTDIMLAAEAHTLHRQKQLGTCALNLGVEIRDHTPTL